jgi:hypothetical protein
MSLQEDCAMHQLVDIVTSPSHYTLYLHIYNSFVTTSLLPKGFFGLRDQTGSFSSSSRSDKTIRSYLSQWMSAGLTFAKPSNGNGFPAATALPVGSEAWYQYHK